MKKKSNLYGKMSESSNNKTSLSSTSVEEEMEWEMRPGGMLVQKRTQNANFPAPVIGLRVAYGAARYEISVNSRATFGEVKKLITAETGLQVGEQKVIFKGKERENSEYLDMCGVKDRSKVIVMEDPASIERRFIQMRRNAKIQSAYRAINDVSMEVDKLADQVSEIKKSISNGVKVPEVQITTLIEMFMRQAIKLDNIAAEGDAFAQKNLQGKKVQKCVETLDTLKISNARVKPVIVTTKWESFDPSPAIDQWEIFD
ncbi:BAG family molecular chaperone regulator 3-like [Durio zibethinus]|uniref:BAG family molecular chaperone regulator 3-like n=1 Tax=Durio zibethinus TaxID=66656 RepID=A0A6P5Z9S0_DURZI|nr:BAG family molecular chaperone regulator 3-like [Durio zibethinus]